MLSVIIIFIAIFQGLVSLLPVRYELFPLDATQKRRKISGSGILFVISCLAIIFLSFVAFSINESNDNDNLSMLFNKIDATKNSKPFIEPHASRSRQTSDSSVFDFCLINSSPTIAYNVHLRLACIRMEGQTFFSDPLFHVPEIPVVAGERCREVVASGIDSLPNELHFYLNWDYRDKDSVRYTENGIYKLDIAMDKFYYLPDEGIYKPYYDAIRQFGVSFD